MMLSHRYATSYEIMSFVTDDRYCRTWLCSIVLTRIPPYRSIPSLVNGTATDSYKTVLIEVLKVITDTHMLR